VTLWVALLYSVVLTPLRRVTSADLIGLALDSGLCEPRTVLSTGNLVFSAAGTAGALEAVLESAIRRAWGKPIPVLVRSAPELLALLDANPFPELTAEDPTRVAVRLMRAMPEAAVLEQIGARASADEAFAFTDRALWVATTRPFSETRAWRAMAAPRTGIGTFRSVSSLTRIAAAFD
jgi:uncharacterized protein (DUF1697 family)